MHIISRYYKDILLIAILALIAAVSVLFSAAYGNGTMINGGDTDYFINPSIELSRAFSTWGNESLGIDQYFTLSKIFIAGPAYLISLIGFSVDFTNMLYFTLLFALPGVSIFVLSRYLGSSRSFSFVAGLFYMLNSYIFMKFHFPVPHLQIAYISLPLFLLVAIWSLKKKGRLFIGALIFSLLLAAISRTINMWIIVLAVTPLLITVFNSNWFAEAVKFRSIVIYFVIVLILNVGIVGSYIASFSSFQDFSDSQVTHKYRQDSESISSKYNIIDILAGYGQQSWTDRLVEERSGYQAYSFYKTVDKPVWVVLSIVPILFLLITALFSRLNRKLIPFIIVFAILATGLGSPTGGLYELTLSKLPIYKDMFRDTWTYWSMPLMFSISLLIINLGIKPENTKVLNKLGLLLMAIFVIINFVLLHFVFDRLISPYWIVNLPQYYQDSADYIEDEVGTDKVLLLPLTDHPYGYTDYRWGYSGPEPLRNMTDTALIDKYFYPIASGKYIDMLEDMRRSDLNGIKEFLDVTGTSNLLIRKDLKSDYERQSATHLITQIENDSCFEMKYKNDGHNIYEFNCNSIPQSNLYFTDTLNSGNRLCNGVTYTDLDQLNSKPDGFCFTHEYRAESVYIEEDEILIDEVNKSIVENLPRLSSVKAMNGGVYISDKAEFELWKNSNFTTGVWGGENISSCDGIGINPNTNRKISTTDGMLIETGSNQQCIYTGIEIEKLQQSMTVKISYRSDQSIGYCLYNKDLDKCLVYNVISGQDADYDATYKYDNEGEFKAVTIVINNIYVSQDQTLEFYLYFNPERNSSSEYLVESIAGYALPVLEYKNSDTDSVNEAISSLSGSNSWINIESATSGEYLILQQNYNPQFRLLYWDGILPKFVSSESHFVANGWANGWVMSGYEDKDLSIVYLPQLVFIAGLIINAWALLWLAILMAFRLVKKG